MRNPATAAALFLLAAAARAELRTEEVEYKDGEAVLLGYLAYDDALAGPRPGVLVVHEWWGHDAYARRRAEDVARLGYVAFALDMYGKGVRAETPEQAAPLATKFRRDRKRAAAGLAVLRRHARVDPARIAAIGYCFGGAVALELARDGADLRGVVSFHGSLGTDRPAEASTFKAKVLVCNGADDAAVPREQVAAFEDEMRAARADYTIIHYGGAVHAFTNPEADRRGIRNVAYHAAADRRSFEHMKLFLAEVLA
jgi:dienelactone hydrolase